tara:strand:- start:323 stop:490 length:168 start_codon:yes stop_codon:yes gene_type:complete
MRRIEKVGEVIVRSITFPLRMAIGICKAIEINMPEKLEMPIEIKRKDKNADETTS